jgi:outer membrane protein assembly factor BamB
MVWLWITTLVGLGLPSAAGETDWPQWRGPHRDGRCDGPTWPKKLDSNHLSETWRIDLGPSYSGPIVSGNRVFTTETRDRTFEVVTALDRNTGERLWQHQWEGSLSVPFFAKSNGDWIRSTPACDGERLYVAGMRDVLVCLEAATGREVWRVDFVKHFNAPLPDFGFVCSPLVHSNSVYVQAGAGVVGLNKMTGEILWRTLEDKGGLWGSAFSSPILATLCGRTQLLVQSREQMAGIDPESGAVLWNQPVEAFRGMNILTPVADGDTLFTSTYGGKTIGFKVMESAGKFSVTKTWTHKSQGYMSTPVVVDGVAYHHLRSQRVMAFDLRKGEELWTSDRSFGKYWSLIAQGDRILALDQRGELFLLKADRVRMNLLDQRKLTTAETWAHLAVSGNQLFVRELNRLAAFRWIEPKP